MTSSAGNHVYIKMNEGRPEARDPYPPRPSARTPPDNRPAADVTSIGRPGCDFCSWGMRGDSGPAPVYFLKFIHRACPEHSREERQT